MDKRVNDESLEFRKTDLKSKYDYLSAILKKKEYVEIIKSFNQTYSSSTLLEMAKQRINSIEKGEIRKEDLEKGAPLGFEMLIEDENRNYHNRLFNLLHAAASSGNEDLILFESFFNNLNLPLIFWDKNSFKSIFNSFKK